MTDASVDVAALAETADKVREFLSPFDDVEVGADGTCSLRYGSAMVHVTVNVFDEDQAVVKVKAEAVKGAQPTPELYKFVAQHQAEMGHLSVTDADDGTATICFSHSLLGEFLNPAELRMTVVAVAFAADRLDDELASRFGGAVHDSTGNHA